MLDKNIGLVSGRLSHKLGVPSLISETAFHPIRQIAKSATDAFAGVSHQVFSVSLPYPRPCSVSNVLHETIRQTFSSPYASVVAKGT